MVMPNFKPIKSKWIKLKQITSIKVSLNEYANFLAISPYSLSADIFTPDFIKHAIEFAPILVCESADEGEFCAVANLRWFELAQAALNPDDPIAVRVIDKDDAAAMQFATRFDELQTLIFKLRPRAVPTFAACVYEDKHSVEPYVTIEMTQKDIAKQLFGHHRSTLFRPRTAKTEPLKSDNRENVIDRYAEMPTEDQ